MRLLTLLVFLPLTGALALFLTRNPRAWRLIASIASGAVLALAALVAGVADWSLGSMQLEERFVWIPSFGAGYHLGVDGLSLPLVLLTALLTFLSIVYSTRNPALPRAYYALFLVLETGLFGVFTALDLLLFYLFWEVALVPMYFIIGVWGHERRAAAALKFFLYTRFGSLALLLSIVALFLGTTPHTFDLPQIVAAQPYAGFGWASSLVLLGFFLAFAIKLPIFPLHAWLPDAHTEAPTAGSVVLAGLLLKMGGYGFLRVALPTVPGAFSAWATGLAALAVFSAIYGAAVAMAQTDLKRLIAVTSVNHMAYVLLGVSAAAAGWASEADRAAAAAGAAYEMVAHGLVTGGLFFLVGMLAGRAGTREIARLGGVWSSLPVYGTLFAALMFASLGLPTLAHFVAEVQIVLGALGAFPWAAVLMLVAVFVTTAMFLWTLQRVLLGRPALPPGGLRPLDGRERLAGLTLLGFAFLLGILPGPLVGFIESSARALNLVATASRGLGG